MKSQIIYLHGAVRVKIIKPISMYKCNCKITPFSSRTAVLLLEGLLCWFGFFKCTLKLLLMKLLEKGFLYVIKTH